MDKKLSWEKIKKNIPNKAKGKHVLQINSGSWSDSLVTAHYFNEGKEDEHLCLFLVENGSCIYIVYKRDNLKIKVSFNMDINFLTFCKKKIKVCLFGPIEVF